MTAAAFRGPAQDRSPPPAASRGRNLSPRARSTITEVAVAKRKLDEEAAEVNAELRSLQARKNNIPARDLEVSGAALP